jgi:hypothetical protein
MVHYRSAIILAKAGLSPAKAVVTLAEAELA